MMKRCTTSNAAHWLMVIGSVNWGLVGIGYFAGMNLNVVNLLLGKIMWLEAIVYILVGVAGVMMIRGCKCKTCKDGACATCSTGEASCSAKKEGSCSGEKSM